MGFNLKDIKGNSGVRTSIPSGRYTVEFLDPTVTTTAGGDPMIKTKLKVVDGKEAGRYAFDQLVFGDASLWKIKQLLELVGSKLVDSTDVSPEEVAAELEGNKVSVYLEEGLSNTQKPINNVKNYQAAPTVVAAAGKKPTSPAGKSLFS